MLGLMLSTVRAPRPHHAKVLVPVAAAVSAASVASTADLARHQHEERHITLHIVCRIKCILERLQLVVT